MRRIALVLVLVLARQASASEPSWHCDDAEDECPDRIDWRETPAWIEWAPWISLGVGAKSVAPSPAARTTQPVPPPDQELVGTFEAGVEALLPLGNDVRVGPWVSLHSLEPMVGGEVMLTHLPRTLDMFCVEGEGVLFARGGGGKDHATGTLGWGYRIPWKIWGPHTTGTRYEIGARVVMSYTRAYHDPLDWTATFGIEFEPIGALRYLAQIRGWY